MTATAPGTSAIARPTTTRLGKPATRVTGLSLAKVAGSTELSWTGQSGTGIGGSWSTTFCAPPHPPSSRVLSCVESDGADTARPSIPWDLAPGEIAFYVVRPENSCGPGSLGTTSEGVERVLLSGGCVP